jgi:hypothetical protein
MMGRQVGEAQLFYIFSVDRAKTGLSAVLPTTPT